MWIIQLTKKWNEIKLPPEGLWGDSGLDTGRSRSLPQLSVELHLWSEGSAAWRRGMWPWNLLPEEMKRVCHMKLIEDKIAWNEDARGSRGKETSTSCPGPPQSLQPPWCIQSYWPTVLCLHHSSAFPSFFYVSSSELYWHPLCISACALRMGPKLVSSFTSS